MDRQFEDVKRDAKALKELNVMMDAIKRDAPDYFGMGQFSCKKKLVNGATVRVVIRMPPLPAGLEGKKRK